MYQRLTALVLHWLRVPPEPQPPLGDPASLRVFRAGHNYFKLRLFRWGVTQLIALAGIVFWVSVFIGIDAEVQARRQSGQVPVAPTNARDFRAYLEKIGTDQQPAGNPAGKSSTATGLKKASRLRIRINGWAGFRRLLVEAALLLPLWAFPVLWALKIAGIIAYLVQLPVTYAIARLDYEMRWYMVTDRSLRIRHGVWKIVESTMSFANIQQVEVSQGPVQRVLGLGDVQVQSAGGGAAEVKHHQAGEDMHLGLFHSVTNATEIRDLILDRLRHFRQAGLGDPDDHGHPAPPPAPATPTPGDTLAAARELLAEARALRQAAQ